MKTYIVDSFTKEPFKGNPAGVCFPEFEPGDERMLEIAREFGLSETAFVRQTAAPGAFTIRFFSPKKEIPLCGHATLAAAAVIFRDNHLKEIHFRTAWNVELVVHRKGPEIAMEFPVYDTVSFVAPGAMLSALGVDKVANSAFSPDNSMVLLEIDDAGVLARLTPDYNELLRSYNGIDGIVVTAPSDTEDFDYHYRYFWPWAGTNEDPVTGAAQTFLAKYWGTRLNKTAMKAFQSSQRTGYMNIELVQEKVLLISQAVVILEGNVMVVP